MRSSRIHRVKGATQHAKAFTSGVTSFRISRASIKLEFHKTVVNIRIAGKVPSVWVDGEKYVPRSSRIADTVVAPLKYSGELFHRVNRLVASGYRTAEALRAVTEDSDIDPHNLRTQYYARGAHLWKLKPKEESGVPDSPSGVPHGLATKRSRD